MKRKILFIVIFVLAFSSMSFADRFEHIQNENKFYMYAEDGGSSGTMGWSDYEVWSYDIPAGTYNFNEIGLYSSAVDEDRELVFKVDGNIIWSDEFRYSWGLGDYDYLDYYNINETVTVGDGSNETVRVEFYLGKDDSWASSIVGGSQKIELYYDTFEPAIPENNKPTVYITSPSNTDYNKNNKPSIRYSVYDTDGDSLDTKVFLDGRIIDYGYNLSSGSSRTVEIPTSNWDDLPPNVLRTIKVEVEDDTGYDNTLSDYDTTYIKKIDSPPTVTEGVNGSSFSSLSPPDFSALVTDNENDNLSVELKYYGTTIDTKNAVSGETVLLNDPNWLNRSFESNLAYSIDVSDNNSTTSSNNIIIQKNNTQFNFSLYEPTLNKKTIPEYTKFSWDISDIDNDNIHMKISSPNVDYNNGILYDGNIGTNGVYINEKELFKFLDIGENTLNIKLDDGFNQETYQTKIDVQKLINLDINSNPTFYIPVFENIKSDVYRKKLQQKLDKKENIYMLELKGSD